METNLINQGLELMLVGMGTVFVFLTVLVFVTSFMSGIVNSVSSDQVAQVTATPTSGVAPSSATTGIDTETLEVITEAIRLHRLRQK